MSTVQPDQVYVLCTQLASPNDKGVTVVGVRKGMVHYYRTSGTSGVIHTMQEDQFLRLYVLETTKTALRKFDKDLEDLLKDDT